MRQLLLLLAAVVAFGQDAADVHVIEINGRLIPYTVQSGYALTQGDILIGRADEVENYRKEQALGRRPARPRSVYWAGTNNSALWPNATMYYTMEPDVPVQSNLLAAIDYWNKVGPFKILPRSSEPNYVTFRKIVIDAACSSEVGMTGGQQTIGVTASCSVGNAIHEIGHAWGLLHEQGRADRDTYVTVLYENIDKRFAYNFDQDPSYTSGGYYDYDSIMHYPVSGFSRNLRDTISTVPLGIPVGQRTALSAGDIDAISRLYGAIPTDTTITSAPSGLTVTVDGTPVTTPQRFNWVPGSQHTVSVPRAQGTAPRYVFARWSDGGAVSHTITASSGVTVFCANFQRQYLATAGVISGAGAVSMVPTPKDGYLADRQRFAVTATPAAGSEFVRWMGTTYLGASGSSVSATPAHVQVFGAASDYEATFAAGPLTVVDSKPRGAQVIVDGNSSYTPVKFAWAAGSTHTISYTTPQMQGNNTHRFLFQQWEDGTAGPRTVTANAGGATYTATFQEQYLLTTDTFGAGTIRLSPPSSDGFYDAGSTVSATAVPGSSQHLRFWQGDVMGGESTKSVVMDQQRAITAAFSPVFWWQAFHSASYMKTPIPGSMEEAVAPGEILAIFGTGVGPGRQAVPIVDGKLPTSLNGCSVDFDGVAAPIVYPSTDQINVIVPYAVSGHQRTSVTVRGQGPIVTLSLPVVETMPGLYTYDGSGKGPVAALNEDGTINSEANPAAPGSVVVLYGTGAGALEKVVPDGQMMGAELVAPKASVMARFDQLAGEVLYAGTAPGLVNGALQVNARIPSDLVGGGQVPVRIVVGNYSSPQGTTIWVK